MKKTLLFLSLSLSLAACNNTENEQAQSENEESVKGREPQKVEWKTYENQTYNLAFKYPSHWSVSETETGDFPVINIFPSGQEKLAAPPYRIHHNAELSFISVFPKSFGTELPSGRSQSLAGNERFTGKAFNADEATALLLENNHVWALHLPFKDKFKMAEGAYTFAQIAVSNFKPKCLDENGNEKPVEDCDPMGGDDFQRYATIHENHRQIVQKVIASFRTLNEKETKKPATAIRVINPQPNQAVSSPLKVNGKARGHWFFEGDFPVRIEDEKGKILGESFASAQGDWMTDKMVTFGATITFDSLAVGKGFVIFEKQNAAGKEDPETFRVPVTFASEE